MLRTGIGAFPCTIRNFCPGGIFLTLEGTSPVEIDDSVQVIFNTELGGQNREFRLRARIAGEFDNGYGCEFFDPEQEAIRALQTLADVAPDASPSATPALASPTQSTNAPALVLRCKELFSSFLTKQVHTLFEHAKNTLFVSARDATSNAQQNLYFDTQKDVERLKEPVQRDFVEIIVSQMDNLGAPLAAMQEPEEDTSTAGLSLVESGEFADWLAVKQIYSRAEPGLREEQFKLERRLRTLSGANIEEENNSIGLAGLCHTFHDALQTVTTPRLARRVVFEASDETVIAALPDFYTQLNNLLEEAGVVADLELPKPVIAKNPDARTEPSAPEVPGGTRGPSGFDQSASYNGEAQATGQSHGVPGNTHTVGGGHSPAVSPAGATPGTQTGSVTGAGFSQTPAVRASAENAHPPASRAGWDGTQAPPSADYPGSGAPASPDQSANASDPQDMTGDMAPHPSLTGGSPFDPHQVVTGNVYSSPMDITHRAYRTAQTPMDLSRQILPADTQDQHLPTYESEQVKGALALLQKQETSQPATARSGPDLKTRVIRALRSRHGYADKKNIPQEEEAAINLISQLVESVLADALVTSDLKPQLRRLEVPLLNVAMRDSTFFAQPNHPADSSLTVWLKLRAAKTVLSPPGSHAMSIL